ncbi:MAG: hypothetical protein KDE54_14585 [Caldilineaceae bacterium]|nr:hypothetical protein [Caldilineaceae bacterium]
MTRSSILHEYSLWIAAAVAILLLALSSVMAFGPSWADAEADGQKNRAALPECARPAWLETTAHPFAVEPLIPTPLPGEERTVGVKQGAYQEYEQIPAPAAEPYTLRWRIGVGIPEKNPLYFPWPAQRPGWYLNWSIGYTVTRTLAQRMDPVRMEAPPEIELGMDFYPMVRTPQGRLQPAPELLAQLAAANPGRTWLIGNEPDVEWQDNATPEQYAYGYRCAYTVIKQSDPTAQIAIGGLSQVTPLRLIYLERLWRFYAKEFGQEMPVDVWNMHAFVLREEAESWGVRIPPGLEYITQGELWDVADHADLALVRGQIVAMRRWMQEHGQREKPLLISEYGILLTAAYGFDAPHVNAFMLDSFDLFNSLSDAEMGYPADDNRLVQRWVWFSTRYPLYPAGNLFTGYDKPTAVMRTLRDFLDAHGDSTAKTIK